MIKMAKRKSKTKSKRITRLQEAEHATGILRNLILIIIACITLFSVSMLWIKLAPLLNYLDSFNNGTIPLP